MEPIKWPSEAYGQLWEKMELELAELRAREGDECYPSMMRVVKVTLRALQAECGRAFADGAEEVAFFREVWPRFYGRFFYYHLLCRFQQERRGQPQQHVERLIQRQIREISKFFIQYQEWWYQYLVEPEAIAAQFTKAYGRLSSLDPLQELFEPEKVTVGSYRAAWGLAYEDFETWLHDEEDRLKGAGKKGARWEWKESKTAAVELLKAQVEIGSIYIDGKPATFTQLQADFEAKYGMSLKAADKLLYATDTRKIEDTPYLGKLSRGFMARKERLGK